MYGPTLRLCGNGLVRELPGTGSKTGTHGTSDATEVAYFGAASQPFADKSAPTPSGQKRVMCTDRATLRLCRSGLVRELPGTGSKIYIYGTSDTTEVTGFRAASQPFADKSAPTPSGQKRVMCTDRATPCGQKPAPRLTSAQKQPIRRVFALVPV
ncbi:hypothetical protein CXB34_32315, partial [Pseudomonas amygdali pv. morsprunorum]